MGIRGRATWCVVAVVLVLVVAVAPSGFGFAARVLSAEPPHQPEPSEIRFSTHGWRTDFSQHSVPLSEIIPGGPTKDGIPAIEDPIFEPVQAAQGWLGPTAPVIAIEIGDDARAYPLAILVWHEIVNDVIGGIPVVITFCPLCNTALLFERTLDGVIHDFGTTGNLRFSDLVMYDRQTETWWQQATGQAIVGALDGSKLAFLPAQLISLEQFAAAWPAGGVLARDTGHDRPYAAGSYAGRELDGERPYVYAGEPIAGISPKERVVTVGEGADGIAFPHASLHDVGVAEETVRGSPIVVFWVPRSPVPSGALDLDDAGSVGSTGVFSPLVDGRKLTFLRPGGPSEPIKDAETGSTWTVTGRAIKGPLVEAQLRPVAHADHFWFAWAAFVPDTRIWTPDGATRLDEID